MNLKPLRNDVLVTKNREEETKSAAGLILTPTGSDGVVKGTVVAVGDGFIKENGEGHVPMFVRVGDVVTFHKSSGTEVRENGEVFVLLNETNILYKVLNNT